MLNAKKRNSSEVCIGSTLAKFSHRQSSSGACIGSTLAKFSLRHCLRERSRRPLPDDDCSGLTQAPRAKEGRGGALAPSSVGSMTHVKPLQSSSGRLGLCIAWNLCRHRWTTADANNLRAWNLDLCRHRYKTFASVEPRFCAKKQTWAL